MREFFLPNPARLPDHSELVVTADTTAVDGDGITIAVVGDLDATTAPTFLAGVLAALPPDPPPWVCLNLAEVPFIDAAGIRALLELRGITAGRGQIFVAANPQPLVRRVMSILGVLELLTAEDDLHGSA